MYIYVYIHAYTLAHNAWVVDVVLGGDRCQRCRAACHVHTHTQTYLHAHTHSLSHTCIHKHSHTHTHTHTRTNAQIVNMILI